VFAWLGPGRALIRPVAAVRGSDHDRPGHRPSHGLLRQLAPRAIPSGRHRDEEGRLRLVVPTLGWDGFVRLAFDEIRLAGAGSPQVTRRLTAALEDLLTIAPRAGPDEPWPPPR
jgi:hypothetical protein